MLIKRTDDVGNWFVFDSARGITTGNDPYIFTSSSVSPEYTAYDPIAPHSSGFSLTAGTLVNDVETSYLYLAIA